MNHHRQYRSIQIGFDFLKLNNIWFLNIAIDNENDNDNE